MNLVPLLLVLFSINSFAAQVVKISGTGKSIAISHDQDRVWQENDALCTYSEGKKTACGKVTKVSPKFAVVKLEKTSPRLAAGNLAVLDGDRVPSSVTSYSGRGRSAQAPKIEPGFMLGLNSGSISGAAETSSKMGLALGFTGDFHLFENNFLETGLFYTQKGATSITSLGTVYRAEQTYNFSYLEVPILYKMKWNVDPIKPMFFVGPYLSLLMSASTQTNISGTGIDSTSTTTDVKSAMNSIDYGIYIGGGAEMTLSPTLTASFVLRYGHGLSNADSSGASIGLRVLQAMAGLRMNLFN